MNSTMVDAPGRFVGSIEKQLDISALSWGLQVAGTFMLLPSLTCSCGS